MGFRNRGKLRSLIMLAMSSLFLVSGCSNQENKQLQQKNNQLEQENATLKVEISQLKDELKDAEIRARSLTIDTTPSPKPAAPESPQQAAFEDIQGGFGETEITQLTQLGVFEITTGKFNPSQPITRAEFVRWLVRANNAIWANGPDKIIRLAEAGAATFTDVPPTHPDFRYIQGMANAGIAVGYDEKTFNPDQPLTREQMIAIKIGLDKGGIEDAILDPQKTEIGSDDVPPDKLASGVPDWSDRNQIAKRFIPAFNSQYYIFWGERRQFSTREDKFNNVDRAFGAIKALKPQAPVTRTEAALCIWLIGNHTTERDKIGFQTAEQALALKAKQETPNPTP